MMIGRAFGHGMYGGGMFLFTLFFAVIFIVVIYFLLRRGQAINQCTSSRHNPAHRDKRDSAEEILRERYARGEISDEEYDARLKRLRGENKEEPVPPIEPGTPSEPTEPKSE